MSSSSGFPSCSNTRKAFAKNDTQLRNPISAGSPWPSSWDAALRLDNTTLEIPQPTTREAYGGQGRGVKDKNTLNIYLRVQFKKEKTVVFFANSSRKLKIKPVTTQYLRFHHVLPVSAYLTTNTCPDLKSSCTHYYNRILARRYCLGDGVDLCVAISVGGL